jgi:hypothetical protein
VLNCLSNQPCGDEKWYSSGKETTIAASPLLIRNIEVEGSACRRFLTGFLLGLLFEPEDEDSAYLRNVGDVYRTTGNYVPEDSILQYFIFLFFAELFAELL